MLQESYYKPIIAFTCDYHFNSADNIRIDMSLVSAVNFVRFSYLFLRRLYLANISICVFLWASFV